MREYTVHVYGITYTVLVSRALAWFEGRQLSRCQAATVLRAAREHHARITRLDLAGGYR